MLTNRQQSFLGTLRLNNHPISTLDVLLGKPVWVNWLGGAGVLPSLASTVRNDSHLLSCQPGTSVEPMTFYFRQTAGGYRLYVREPGNHFGKRVMVYDHSHLGVSANSDVSPSPFELNNIDGRIISLSDLEGDRHQIVLTHNRQGISRTQRPNSPHQYLKTPSEVAEVWDLKILERNVAWLNQPYEL